MIMKRALSVLFLGFVAVTGCGGDDGGGSSDFVGAWMYTGGTDTILCPGRPAVTSPVSGNFSINKGIDADLVLVDGTCNTKMDVKGSVASVRTGQTCTQTDQNGSAMLSFTGGTFTLNGLNGNISYSANLTIMQGGQSTTCQYTETATATKVSK